MEGRQTWVRKMLNAANLGWVVAYSLRKEKSAKKETGAAARPLARARGGAALAGPRARRSLTPYVPRTAGARERAPPLPSEAPLGRGLAASAARDPEEGPRTSGARPPAPPSQRPAAPPGPTATPFPSGKPCGGAARGGAAAAPEAVATESSARGRRVRLRHVAAPASSRHRPCASREKRLVPRKPKPRDANKFGLRTRLPCPRLLGAGRVRARPLARAAAPRGPGRGPGASGAGAPRIPALARTAGGRGGSRAGGFENTEPLIGL